MLDHLRLAIPIFATYARSFDNVHHFDGDLLSLGLHCGARAVVKDDDGQVRAQELYAPYDTLPSSFSDMAVKFYDKGVNTLPYVELKASPNKLMQGHNVYGFESIKLGATQMLGMLATALPQLFAILDVANTEVLHLDATYSAIVEQERMQLVINYLANTSNAHATKRNVAYENYARWGKQNSRYLGRKVYGKFDEVKANIDELMRKKILSDTDKAKLHALQNALHHAKNRLRFEARITKTYLVKNGYPSNLFSLIKHQQANSNLLQQLWQKAFNPILTALKGDITLTDDLQVHESLKSKLQTITAKGKVSYAKANRAFAFYQTIKNIGYDELKKRLPKRTFYRNVSDLVEAGIPKSHLQNLHTQQATSIPLITLCNINFANQVPVGYVAPQTDFNIAKLA